MFKNETNDLFCEIAEIRAEAVQQALAQFAQNGNKNRPSVPAPIKRVSNVQRGNNGERVVVRRPTFTGER